MCSFWISRIGGAALEDDAAQTALMAINFAHNSVMSIDDEPPLAPSMYREPVPVLTTAVAVVLIDAAMGKADLASYLVGERAQFLKYQNVVWLLLLSVTAGWAILLFTSSFPLALFGALVAGWPLRNDLDRLYTEPVTAALLLLTSVLLALAVSREHRAWMLAAGLSFGVLALVKAAMLYVFIGTVAVLIGAYLLPAFRPYIRSGFPGLVLLIVSFALVVAPWMYRNAQEFDTFQIADRGGVVLMVRAEKDRMTAEEYLGAFYVWSHPRVKSLVGAMLGFSENDLERGGRLQRLNRAAGSSFAADDRDADLAGRPDDAISFYRRGRAERVKLDRELEEAGHPSPGTAAEAILQSRALRMIMDDPFKHLATTIPFLWRGAAISFPIFIAVLAYCLWQRRNGFACFVLPSFGMVMFYALFTHFIPRYGEPAVPVAVVSAFVLLHMLVTRTRTNTQGPTARSAMRLSEQSGT